MRIKYDVKPGDKLTILESKMDGPKVRRCTVIREYPKFIMVDFGRYRGSILKAKIYCREVLVFKGWKEDAL